MKNYYILFLLFSLINFSTSFAQTPCQNGYAGQYPCKDVDLLSVLTPDEIAAEEHHGQWLNDIWGWTDPLTEREYAVVGMVNGVSFIDVTDPINPVFLGILPETNASGRSGDSGRHEEGANSWWRDIKVYKNHAYVVAEENNHGMQVFDMTQLRDITNPPVVFEATAMYTKIGSAHNIAINEDTGFAYILSSRGSSVCNTLGLHMVNINDPANPKYENCFDNSLKVHDSQCIIYNGPDIEHRGKEICLNSNESSLSIDDVTVKKSVQNISTFSYSNLFYAHQGWITEDHQYFLSNDEVDETSTGNHTRTLIWDIRDLENPTLIGNFYSNLFTIDHNMYIQDNYVYQSNYTAGLRILNLDNVAEGQLTETAYFDTFHQNNSVIFDGTWSNYPFFKSGNIIVADMRNGLFVLKPTINNVISSEPANVYCPKQDDNVTFEIETSGNDLSYQWQIKNGNQFEDLTSETDFSDFNTKTLTINTLPETEGSHYYRCKVTTSNGTVYYSEPGMLLAGMAPQVDFNFEIVNSDSNNEVKFTNSSEGAATYEWNFGDDSPIVMVENPIHIYSNPGTYEVTLIVTNNCGESQITKTVNIEITSIEGPKLFSRLSIYPNPTQRIVNISLENTNFSPVQLSLYNATGKQIISEKLNKTNFTFHHAIDMAESAKGIYYLMIKSGNHVTRKKVIIQ